MVTQSEKDIIMRCAEKYGASVVVLFGSSLEDDKIAKDIDLAVKGIEPRRFFKFYGELIKQLPRPVDLVDMSHKSLFTDIVEETGTRIYG